MNIPVVTTARLVLRPHRVEDHPACAAMWSDERVTRFIGGKPQSSQEAWFRILRYAGSWQMLGFGFWAICDRATGVFLGEGGFGDFHRGIAALDGVPEIGWAFVPGSWGQGIASEAVGAMVAWADANLSAAETRCLIAQGNAASAKVATRNDYVASVDLADGAQIFSRPRFKQPEPLG